ncbi:MAG: DUF5683 domain-containing protein [Bacteroidota bacterium]
MNRIYLAALLISILWSVAFSQEPDSIPVYQQPDTITPARSFLSDSVIVDNKLRYSDSLVVEQPDFTHSPSKAIMYALVLPGLGQAYNKKYYKMPIVWAAFGAVGYAIVFNTKNYRLAILDYALSPNDDRALKYWRRNMELSYIGLIAVYALQVLDAYVDAQLYSWDVNEDLSMRVAPSLQPLMAPTSLTGHTVGLTCSFNLKGR